MNATATLPVNDTANREMVITRLYDAPRDLVFEAWTDPKHLAQWWGPNGFSISVHSFDFRPGGEWRFTMHGPDGKDYLNKIVYQEIVKPERLVYSHSGDDDETDNFKTTVTFEDQGEKTFLTMRAVFPTAEQLQRVVREHGAIEGGKQTLARLAEHLKASSPDESEIRKLMNEWREGLCAKDLDRMLAHYAPDVLLYEVVPPYQHKGTDAYRASWQACFPYLPPSLGSEMRDFVITVNGDMAFAHGLHRLIDKATGKPATCNWVRVTVCFQRREGRWQVVHEHVSVPFDPMTSKAAFIDLP